MNSSVSLPLGAHSVVVLLLSFQFSELIIGCHAPKLKEERGPLHFFYGGIYSWLAITDYVRMEVTLVGAPWDVVAGDWLARRRG